MYAAGSYGIVGPFFGVWSSSSRGNLAGLGLPAANFTAYLDLTLGVKSTFFADSWIALAVLGRLGVPGRSGLDTFRVDLRIDLRPENVGNFELNMLGLEVVRVVGVVAIAICRDVDLLGAFEDAVGSGGKGLLLATL